MHFSRVALLSALLATGALLGCSRTPAPHHPDMAVADTLPGEWTGTAGGTVEIPPLFPGFDVTRPPGAEEGERGLEFRLRERAAPTAPAQPTGVGAPPAATPLTVEQAAALLARLPALPVLLEEEGFRFPARTPPPPLTGVTVLATFPPPDTAAPLPDRPAAPAPLEVLRIVPEGETELAPHLTVTFSQPMVPLATLAGSDARAVPVRLAPHPAGRWRWIDTRTLRFEPEVRFPMATAFVVEVPAGTRSATGGTLATAVRHGFATPAPRAVGGYPHQHAPSSLGSPYARHGEPGRFGLEPVIVLRFDQRVDPDRVLRTARLRAGGRDHPLRLAITSEVEADSAAQRLTAESEPGRWVALRPTRPLPRDAEVRLALEPGTQSLEGPRATTLRQALAFRTYGPLRVEEHGCGGYPRGERCPPESSWWIRFSNPLDTAAWRAEHLRVEPRVEGFRVEPVGSMLMLSGAFRARTTYRITLDPAIRDRWGQPLGSARTLTLEVGEPGPMLGFPGGSLIVLDPAGPPVVRLHSRGHAELRVRLLRVRPEQWEAFSQAIQRFRRDPAGTHFSPPGEMVLSTTIRPEMGARGFSEVPIDLGPALTDGIGHVIAVVESATPPPARDRRGGWYDRERTHGPAFAWVQGTRIGLSAAIDRSELLAWVTSLETGAPLAGAEVRLLPSGARGSSAADGTARITLSPGGDGVLVARRGADVALLPDQEPGWRDDARGSWRHLPPQDHLAWWVATDRGLYRPGERVHLKGWVRRIEDGPRGGVVAPQGMTGITFASLGPRREELQRGTAVVTPLSGFHLTVELPDELNLGHAQVHLQAQGRVPQQGRETWHQVPVHEFRRPEFEVRAEVDPGPHVVGGSIAATVHAAYYAGGGLADTEVEWRVHSTEAHFAPPGWDGWQFGRQRWWWHGGGEPPRVRTLRGRTGADGAHHMVVDLAGVDPPFAHLVRAEVEARDVNRQVGSARQQTLVHPAAVYAGLRAERGWVRPGDTLSVQVAAVGIGGQPAAGRPVHVRAERIQWRPVPRFRDGAAPAADSVVAECRLVSDTAPTSCALPVRGDGTLLIVAEVRDEQDRPSRSEMIVWVAGGPPLPPSVERPETGEVGLVSDRTSYQPGQMAEVLVQAPFHPAEGMLTVRRAGLLRSERFRVTGPSHTLRVPLAEAQIPGVHLHVELVDAERGVRSASGTLTLPISPRQRELQLQVSPRDTLAAPGAATEVEVAVRDAAGRPVPGAEVALWMVDESVLALGGYTLPDPLEVFHPARAPGVRDHALRPRVLLARRSAGPGTVRGIVLDAETGMPLHGAQASVRDGQVSAAVRGSGEFTLAGLAPGNFRLRVTHPGYRTLERDVAVPAEGAHLGTILLEREGATGIEREQIEALQARAAAAPAGAPPPPPAAPAMARLRAREGGVELEAPAATAAGYDAGQAPVDPVALRTEFAPLAAFEPSLRTGPDGRIGVPVRLPESLTRYRIVAVAVEGSTRYGRGEANLTARRELMVRPSAPRFLNFGDRAEIPVVVQNTTTAPLTVDVALRASGLRAEGAAAQRVTVPAGDRAELRFAVVAERAGRAHLQVVGIAGRLSDAAGVELPVYTPATTEAFATYGEIDGGTPVVLPLSMPRGVIPGFGGVEVTLSSTALQSLTDAVLYLHHYPFEGAEQLASRILAIAALRDVLGAFAAEGLPEPAEIEASVIRDIGRLVALQGFDGGWGFWRRDEGSHPYVSVHAAHALARARTKGYRVPEPSIERALQFLRGIERTLPQGYGPRERNTLTAYAVYVRHRLAEPGAGGEARRLAQRASTDGLTVEAMGWLLHVLAQDLESRAEAAELLRRIRNRATETAATATFATSYGDADHLLLHSARRSDAVVLEALIAADPRSDLIPKTARGLLAHRTRGRWQGTQENAWVLLALERYFATYEATTPNFVSGVWLGERYAGGYSFRGRTTERHHLEIPMREVARLAAATPAPRPSSAGAAGDVDLLLQREGAGRMYYRAGLRYAPADLTPDPDQRGFSVERSYEALDDPADVQRDADGTWRIRAGTRVRVRLSMIAPERRHHVALVDPLPAGFESVNPDLAGVGFTDEPPPVPLPMPRPGAGLRPSPGEIGIRPGPWWGRWWVHQNLRDDRAEAFATLLPAGSYQYTYIARATTPGVFVVPPPRAEEMYHPETFGRGAGVRVVVEGR